VDGDGGSGTCRVYKQQPGRDGHKQDNRSHRYTQHVDVWKSRMVFEYSYIYMRMSQYYLEYYLFTLKLCIIRLHDYDTH
jgi:hypothetical protein